MNNISKAIKAELRRINRIYKCKIIPEQVTSLCEIVKKNEIISRWHQLPMYKDKIIKDYSHGVSIPDLSKKYNFPQLRIADAVGATQKEFNAASDADPDSPRNQLKIAARAATNEDIFVDYFMKLGISIRTQAELVVEQTKLYGRPISTPDLVFADTVYVNGIHITWIDFKDYIATDFNYLYKSNMAQAAKYVSVWGPGALCYSKGFINKDFGPDVHLLDTYALGLKFKS